MKLNEIYTAYNYSFSKDVLPYIKCQHCGNIYYYPRDNCPFCGGSAIEIMQSSGKGEIYSFTEFNKGYYGIISLNDGFRVYMDISGNNPEIGLEIHVKFKNINGNVLPYAEIENKS